MKRTLVCLLLGGLTLLLVAQSSPALSGSVNVQRLLRFSGTVTPEGSGSTTGTRSFTLTFTLYKEPYGGTAQWTETQNVQLDAQGRYTVLLGANTVGGLPMDIFALDAAHWLDVGGLRQPEESRTLMVAPYTRLTAAPTGSATTSTEGEALAGPGATDLVFTFVLLIMFLGGVAMLRAEILQWRERQELYFRKLPAINPEANPATIRARFRRATEMLQLTLSAAFRSLRGPARASVENPHSEGTRSATAAAD